MHVDCCSSSESVPGTYQKHILVCISGPKTQCARRSYVLSGNTDLAGLLCANPAMKGVLKWHIDDLRQELTAARFEKYGPTPQQHAEPAVTSTNNVGGRSDGRRWETSPPQETPHTTDDKSAEWPYASASVQAAASLEFDPRATLGDEESLSTSCASGRVASQSFLLPSQTPKSLLAGHR